MEQQICHKQFINTQRLTTAEQSNIISTSKHSNFSSILNRVQDMIKIAEELTKQEKNQDTLFAHYTIKCCLYYFLKDKSKSINGKKDVDYDGLVKFSLSKLTSLQNMSQQHSHIAFEFQETIKNQRASLQSMTNLFLKCWKIVSLKILLTNLQFWNSLQYFVFWLGMADQERVDLEITKDVDAILKKKVSELKQFENNKQTWIKNDDVIIEDMKVLQKMKKQHWKDKESFGLKKLNSSKSLKSTRYKKFPMLQDLMHLELNFDTITLIDECQTYDCDFLLFLLPFCFLLGETFTFFDEKSVKNTYLHQKVNKLRSEKICQLKEEQVIEKITFLLKYDRHSSDEITEELRNFIQNNEEKMSSFMPVYYEIFRFHAFEKHQFLKEISSDRNPEVCRNKVKNKIQEIEKRCKKYHNEDI